MKEEDFSDEDVAKTFHALGLGQFAGMMHDENRQWHLRLSGGQQKRLLVARGLLQKPDIWLMDEIDAGLDREWKQRVHQLMEDRLSGTTVVSILHENPPLRGDGSEFFDSVLRVENGMAELFPVPGHESNVHNIHEGQIIQAGNDICAVAVDESSPECPAKGQEITPLV